MRGWKLVAIHPVTETAFLRSFFHILYIHCWINLWCIRVFFTVNKSFAYFHNLYTLWRLNFWYIIFFFTRYPLSPLTCLRMFCSLSSFCLSLQSLGLVISTFRGSPVELWDSCMVTKYIRSESSWVTNLQIGNTLLKSLEIWIQICIFKVNDIHILLCIMLI